MGDGVLESVLIGLLAAACLFSSGFFLSADLSSIDPNSAKSILPAAVEEALNPGLSPKRRPIWRPRILRHSLLTMSRRFEVLYCADAHQRRPDDAGGILKRF